MRSELAPGPVLYPDAPPEAVAFAASDYGRWVMSREGQCFTEAKAIGEGLYAGIKRLLYHWTLITGEIDDYSGYLDRWCYATEALALHALRTWNGSGDPPDGWHRHPRSGRRRHDGDPAKEYIER